MMHGAWCDDDDLLLLLLLIIITLQLLLSLFFLLLTEIIYFVLKILNITILALFAGMWSCHHHIK